MAEGFKEALFLRSGWRFLLPDYVDPCIRGFDGNKGAVQIAVDPVTNSNLKQIDVRHHFLRERVEQGEFQITHVKSENQHVDFSTKPLPKEAFRFHRNFMMNMTSYLGGGVASFIHFLRFDESIFGLFLDMMRRFIVPGIFLGLMNRFLCCLGG